MIQYQNMYLDHIASVGVGKNDKVASSQKSYVAYLNRVSKELAVDITPTLLRTESEVERIAAKLRRLKVNDRSVNNIAVAMRHYVDMVVTKDL